jgi:carbamoyltransferase
MKDKINSAVKYRETFRPFAPSILEEEKMEYFRIPDNVQVPYMEQVYSIRAEKRSIIPAVTHHDGTGRLQTVSKELNPLFHSLISKFRDITGVPVVLNTSFNVKDEPIVCSPTDALRTFFSCGMDLLIIGNFIISKSNLDI